MANLQQHSSEARDGSSLSWSLQYTVFGTYAMHEAGKFSPATLQDLPVGLQLMLRVLRFLHSLLFLPALSNQSEL